MSSSIDRRAMLKLSVSSGLSATPLLALDSKEPAPPAWHKQLIAFVETHRRADGGYAWADVAESHLTPTFAAVGCYQLLKQVPPNKAKLVEFIRTHHPFHLKKLERDIRDFEFQQIQSLIWLGEDPSSFREQVRGWTKPYTYPTQYEKSGNPVFRYELMAIVCRHLLGMPFDDVAAAFKDYLASRRRKNGSFNLTPAADGSDGHVMNTWWGLSALKLLGDDTQKQPTADWLQKCQRVNGGLSYQPNAEFADCEDIAYTWAAVRALKSLSAVPARIQDCIASIQSLMNSDGGFSARPAWASNLVATYYALDALDPLGALNAETKHRPSPAKLSAVPADLKVFSIQIEAHGTGSPAEAVDLSRALGIHMWGAKNAKPGWIAKAQALADKDKTPVTFFVANEEYGTWVNVPGLGTYSHTSDIIAPAGAEIGESLANSGTVTWPQFRDKRLAPLQKGQGRLVWQFGENEELTRVYLDDSIQRGGYAAISTFHFGNPDFTNSSPFLYLYKGQIPFIAIQDAHGSEPWWFADMTTGFRTLFLGTKPNWENWLNALRNNWVVAVRHDAVSRQKTWMHGGSRQVLDFVRERERDWRWWDNPKIQRPFVSIVAIRPDDQFEVARPDKGVMIRVRCAWENTAQGLPKKAITTLKSLSIDGKEVMPTLSTRKKAKGNAQEDYYHQFHLAAPAAGKHEVKAVVRLVETDKESSRSISFEV